MGDDAAVQALILAHLQGSLGLPAKDLVALAKVCADGAALGTASGANCIGASHWDGSLPNIARDPFQALAWHLAAARAGHFNSQHDLGWLLYSGQAASVAQGDHRETGLFWLRRAAENGHVYAQRRLEEAGEALAEEADSSRSAMRWIGPLLAGTFATLVVGWLMRGGHAPAPREGTLRVMTYGSGMRVTAVLMLAGAAFVSYAAWHARPSQFAVAMVVAACLIAGALFLFYQVFAVRIAWDEQALTYRSPLAGTRRIPWDEVQETGYSTFMQCHYLKTAHAGRIWISGMLRGFEELGELLAGRFGPTGESGSR
jgi:TPR repeat protein